MFDVTCFSVSLRGLCLYTTVILFDRVIYRYIINYAVKISVELVLLVKPSHYGSFLCISIVDFGFGKQALSRS